MAIEENDVVETLVDLPELGICRGTRGTVVMVFAKPRLAYEVEFIVEGQSDRPAKALLPEQVRLVWIAPDGPYV